MKVEVRVYPKDGVLDPQGKAIAAALGAWATARCGTFAPARSSSSTSPARTRRRVEADARKMAEELLANTVIEGFDVKVVP